MSARTIVLGLVAAVVFLGCSTVSLRTADRPTTACDLALLQGVLTNNRPNGLALRAPDQSIVEVLWPFGYSARGFVGSMELVDPAGHAIAREGDFVSMGGGVNGEGLFVACAGTIAKVDAPD